MSRASRQSHRKERGCQARVRNERWVLFRFCCFEAGSPCVLRACLELIRCPSWVPGLPAKGTGGPGPFLAFCIQASCSSLGAGGPRAWRVLGKRSTPHYTPAQILPPALII